MTQATKTVWKVLGEIAKETALEGKERFKQWAEAEKMKKYQQQVARKDAIGNDILAINQHITTTEEKLDHLYETSTESVTVSIEGMAFSVSIDTITMQYEEELAHLSKQKEKLAKQFLQLEEKINNHQAIREKIDAIEKRMPTHAKERTFSALVPLLLELPLYLKRDEYVFEDAFGVVELRYRNNCLECYHNGLILNIKLSKNQSLEKISLVDWRADVPVYLADGHATHVAELDWKNGSPSAYQQAFSDMLRAVEWICTTHFAPSTKKGACNT